MEMHQVRYFLAVAEELNFTRASERCNVTQPSLSRAIKLLEEELGGLLFHRERDSTRLTDLGHMVRPYLQSVHDQSSLVKRLSREFVRRWALKLGIMTTISPDEIVDLIANIRTHFAMRMPKICARSFWQAILRSPSTPYPARSPTSGFIRFRCFASRWFSRFTATIVSPKREPSQSKR